MELSSSEMGRPVSGAYHKEKGKGVGFRPVLFRMSISHPGDTVE